MRRILSASILATLPLVGCFDVAPPLDTSSSDATTSESTVSPPEPPPAEGSTGTGAIEDHGASSSDDDGTSTGVAVDPGTSSSTSAVGSSSDEGSTSSTGEGTETGLPAMDESSTSGEPCGFELPALLWAADATITAPMGLEVVPILPDMPLMARSYAADAGTVTFELELSCPTDLTVRALVWDHVEGAEPQNADSYYVTVDGLPVPEPVWAYGCQTMGLGPDTWSWQQLTQWTGVGCGSNPYAIMLDAGLHELTFRNREAGGGIDAAAIVAIAVTDDPNFDPSSLYDPAGP